MSKKTINHFANEDALEGFNLQRLHLQMQSSRGNGRLPALSVENRHRIPDTTANFSNIQYPATKIPNLFTLRRVWKIASPVLRLGKYVCLLGILFFLFPKCLLFSATVSWDGGTNGTAGSWSTGSNWAGDSLPASGDDIIFSTRNGASGTIASPLTVSGNRNYGLITFDNVNSKLPSILVIDTNASGTTARTLSVSAGITLANATTTVQFQGSNGALSYVLGANNTFTVSSGGTLKFDSAVPISGSYGITKTGAGTLTLNGTNTYTGNTTINAGNLTISGGNAITDSGTVILANTAGVNFNVNSSETIGTLQGGGITGGTVNIAASQTLTVNQTSDQTFAGVIAGATGALTKTGANTLTLSGSNTYGGLTTINAGNLTISGGSAIADTGIVTLANTAGVGLNVNSSETVASLQGGGSSGGIVTIAASQTLTVAETGSQSFAGALQGSGSLTKSGAGTLTLSGSNTNSGAVSVTTGTLALSGANALSSGISSLNATSSTISLTDGSGRTYTISNGGLNLSDATVRFDIGATSDRLTFTNGAATLSGTNTIYLSDIGSFSYSSPITLISAASGLNGATWSLNSTAAPTGYSYSLSSTATELSLVAVQNSAFYYWKGANGSTWGTANNWTSDSAGNTVLAGAPTSNADVVFAATGASNLSNTLGADYTINSLLVSTAGVTIAGANTVTASATSSSAYNISATSGTTAISANLAGSGAGLTKSGAGTLTLSGANTFAGGVALSAGTLNLNSATAPGNGTITITGGTLDNTSGSSVTFSNNNAQNWNGDFTFQGTRDLNLGTGAVTLGASRQLTVNGANLTVGGVISGSGFSLTKAGAGNLVLGGANAYSGGTTLSEGTLTLNNSGSSGTTSAIGTGTFTIAGGTLDNTSGSAVTLSTNNAQSWNGDFAFTGTNDLNLGTGAVTMNANRIVTVNSGNLTVGGAISGSTASFSLTKAGAGTLVLGGSNAYTGATTINAGTLRTSTANVINDASAVSIASGAAFALGGSDTVASISGAGNITLGSNTLTFGDSTNQTVSGTISGTGALVKNGGGAITLSGNNAYSGGTTISTGTIKIGDNNALGTGSLKLGVSGTTASITFTSTDSTDRTISNSLTTFAGSNWNTTFGSAGTGNLTFGNTTSVALGSSRTFTVNNTWTSFANAFTGTGDGITKNGTGTLILLGANSYTGASTINAGTLQLGNGGSTGSLSTLSAITVNATLAFNRTNTITQGTDFAAVISGTGALIQAGSGNLILSGANSYTGATTINAGVLRASNNTSLGTTAGGATVASGAALELSGGIAIGAEALGLSGTGIASGGALRNTAGDNTYQGAITLNAATRINSDSGNLNLSGGIGGAGQNLTVGGSGNTTISSAIATSTGTLIKDGTGTLTLSAASTYTGTTTINNGTVRATAANALGGTGDIVVNNGGSLLVTTENALNDAAGITLAGGTLSLNGSFSESIGALTLSANSVIDLAGFNGTLTFSGLGAWANDASLAITNWNGINKYGTPVGSGVADRRVVFTSSTGLDSNLGRISFFSGSFGVGFAGTAFEMAGGEIGPVPEPETIVTALILLLGGGLFWARRQLFRRKKSIASRDQNWLLFPPPPAMSTTTINGVCFPKDQAPQIIKAIAKIDVFSQRPLDKLEPELMRTLQEFVFGSAGSDNSAKKLLKNLHKSPEALKYLALLLVQRSNEIKV